MIFSGTSHPLLAQEIASLSGIPLGKLHVGLFPDNEISVEIQESVQGKNVFVLQSLGANPNIYLMELLIILDALRRGGAASITVIFPYFAYGRQDRMDRPGVPITAKLVANLLRESGADRLVTMDLHSEQIEGFFDIPVEHLYSRELLIPFCSRLKLENMVAVAPDKGGIKIASAYARGLGIPIALIDKERINASKVVMQLFIGNVEGKTVLLTDDVCSTAGTLVAAAQFCAEHGAARIFAIVGHGLFIGDALKKIEESPIEKVITTNTIPIDDKVFNHPKIQVISIASLFA